MINRLFVLRIATSLIFIVSGVGHLLRPQQIFSQLGKNIVSQLFLRMPFLETFIFISGFPLFFFGLMLLMNKYIKLTTSILLISTIVITVATHFGIESMGPMVKNLIIIASLYFFHEPKKIYS
jgi:hypothetical protein